MIVLRGKDIERRREGERGGKRMKMCHMCSLKIHSIISRAEKGISLNVKLPYKDQPDYVFN